MSRAKVKKSSQPLRAYLKKFLLWQQHCPHIDLDRRRVVFDKLVTIFRTYKKFEAFDSKLFGAIMIPHKHFIDTRDISLLDAFTDKLSTFDEYLKMVHVDSYFVTEFHMLFERISFSSYPATDVEGYVTLCTKIMNILFSKYKRHKHDPVIRMALECAIEGMNASCVLSMSACKAMKPYVTFIDTWRKLLPALSAESLQRATLTLERGMADNDMKI